MPETQSIPISACPILNWPVLGHCETGRLARHFRTQTLPDLALLTIHRAKANTHALAGDREACQALLRQGRLLRTEADALVIKAMPSPEC